MSAFFVATVTIHNPEKYEAYAQKAVESIRAYDGEVIARGKANGPLAGQLGHHAVGVVKFPDMTSLDTWYQSDQYQAIIGLRDEAADAVIIKYSEPS